MMRVEALWVALAISMAAVAQEKPSNVKADEGATVSQPARQSSEAAMRRLIHAFAGSWATSEVFDTSAEMPKGGKGSGHVSYRPGPGGQCLIEEYRSTGSSGEYSGLGIIWWDEHAQGYMTTWCESSPQGCRILSTPGKWEENSLVLLDQSEVEGQKVTTRETFSDITPTSFVQTLGTIMPDGTFKRLVTIKNTRQP